MVLVVFVLVHFVVVVGIVVVNPRHLPLKFGQNWVNIADIEFAALGGGGGWWCADSFSCQTQL